MRNEERSRLLLEVIPRTMRLIRHEMRKVAGEDFTVPQFRILNKLTRSAETNGSLAEWMGVSAPTMSKMVDKLVKRGHISRKAEGSDRRQIVLTCTKKGMERANSIKGVVQKALAEKISDLPDEKRRALTEGLLVLKEMFR